jgi:hypothetical protein
MLRAMPMSLPSSLASSVSRSRVCSGVASTSDWGFGAIGAPPESRRVPQPTMRETSDRVSTRNTFSGSRPPQMSVSAVAAVARSPA